MGNSWSARIQNIYGRLSPLEKRMANDALQNPKKIFEITIDKWALELGLAPSGITRFCRKLGYNGFRQFKLSLASQTKSQSDLILPAVKSTDNLSTVCAKVFQSSIKALNDTQALLDMKTLEKAVNLLHQAPRIDFYGVGTSATIAMDSYYRLMRIGYPASCATDSQIMRLAALGMRPGDVAVGISHSGRTVETRQALRSANEQGAHTLAITSYKDSPICSDAEMVIEVYSDESRYPIEAVSARLAHIAVLDVICVALALREPERTAKHIHSMNEIFENIRR